jgi:hypothetical protein
VQTVEEVSIHTRLGQKTTWNRGLFTISGMRVVCQVITTLPFCGRWCRGHCTESFADGTRCLFCGHWCCGHWILVLGLEFEAIRCLGPGTWQSSDRRRLSVGGHGCG